MSGADEARHGLAPETVRGADGRVRCRLPSADPRYVRYHDVEWGRPLADDTRLYEKVCLEGFQSGLAWSTILYRREALREAFAGFDIDTVADYDAHSVARLMRDARLIRNRRKIESAINNARRARALREEAGSLGVFFWSFEPGTDARSIAATDPIGSATRLAAALKARGWTFVGPTTMHALMQALGLVNDHVDGCWVRDEVERARTTFRRPSCRPVRR